MVIQPLESVALHQADLGRMDTLRLSLQPAGYEATETFAVPAVAAPAAGSATADHADEGGGASAVRTVMVGIAASHPICLEPCTALFMQSVLPSLIAPM